MATALPDRTWLVVLEATQVSAGARVVLLCLIGLLLVVLGFLIALAWVVRRRTPPARGAPVAEVRAGSPEAGVVACEPTGVIAKICPECRSRHDLAETVCGRDGSELAVIN